MTARSLPPGAAEGSAASRVAGPAPSSAARLQAGGGRVRLRTLVWLRWVAIIGQTGAVLVVQDGLGYAVPLVQCFIVIGASVVLNVVVSIAYPSTKLLSDFEASLYLAFDIVQLAVLLFLTGGVENPFTLLFLAPVAISASMLNLRITMSLIALVFVLVSALAIWHLPLPWTPGQPLSLPPTYIAGLWVALLLGIGFTAAYAWRVAVEAARMSDALAATQLILAREQQLAALGGLAAAAAHELGTPLATIHLVARELEKELPPDSPYADDIALLASQSIRCREILSRLAAQPEGGDEIYGRQSLAALIEEAISPYQDAGIEIVVTMQGAPPEPVLQRRAEIVHALSSLVENAADFARTRVLIEGAWDDETVSIAIYDDGPGFSTEILTRLGEPYITSRPLARAALDDPNRALAGGHEGMGLGFFIAKTLLEHTGGQVTFGNHSRPLAPSARAGREARGAGYESLCGAMVAVRWPRSVVGLGAPAPTAPPVH